MQTFAKAGRASSAASVTPAPPLGKLFEPVSVKVLGSRYVLCLCHTYQLLLQCHVGVHLKLQPAQLNIQPAAFTADRVSSRAQVLASHAAHTRCNTQHIPVMNRVSCAFEAVRNCQL
jgi:hypothetical protein